MAERSTLDIINSLQFNPVASEDQPNEPPEAKVGRFLETHATANRANEYKPEEWATDIAPRLQQRFPGINTDQFQKPYQQQRSLEAARHKYEGVEENIPSQVTRRLFPGVSEYSNIKLDEMYKAAAARLESGNPTDKDYDVIAGYERLKESDRQAGMVRTTANALLGVGRIGTEAYLANAAIKGASAIPGLGWLAPSAAAGEAATAPTIAGLGTRAIAYGARTAATTAAMPAMYAEEASQRAVAGGGQWTDPKNLAPAFALGALQTAVLGSLSHVGNLDGVGAKAVLQRIGAKTAIGTVEQQGADILGHAFGLQTSYGTLGDLMQSRGPAEDIQAFKHATIQVMTFAAFSALHSGNPDPVLDAYKKSLVDLKGKGYSAEKVADVAAQSLDQAAQVLQGTPTKPEALAAVEKLPEGPGKDVAKKVAESLPEVKPAEQEKPAEAAPERQPDFLDSMDTTELKSFAKLYTKTLGKAGENVEKFRERLRDDPAVKALLEQGAAAKQKQQVIQPLPPEPVEAKPEDIHPATKAFKDTFPDAVLTPEGTLKATIGTGDSAVNLHLSDGSHEGSVKLDFTRAKEESQGLQQSEPKIGMRQEGTLDLARALTKFVGEFKKTGLELEYVANGRRAKTYKSMLEKAGYEQVKGPEGESSALRTWKPKEPAAVPDIPAISSDEPTATWSHSGTRFEGNSFVGKDGRKYTVEVKEGGEVIPWAVATVKNEKGEEVGSAKMQKKDSYLMATGLDVEPGDRRNGVAQAMYDYLTEKVMPVVRSPYNTESSRGLWEGNAAKSPPVAPASPPAAQPANPTAEPSPAQPAAANAAVDRLAGMRRRQERLAALAKPQIRPIREAAVPAAEEPAPPSESQHVEPVGISKAKEGEIRGRIDAGEGDLNPDEQDILHRRLAGESVREIEAATGINRGTVANREASGLKKLGYTGSMKDFHEAGTGQRAVAAIENGDFKPGDEGLSVPGYESSRNERMKALSEANDRFDEAHKKFSEIHKKYEELAEAQDGELTDKQQQQYRSALQRGNDALEQWKRAINQRSAEAIESSGRAATEGGPGERVAIVGTAPVRGELRQPGSAASAGNPVEGTASPAEGNGEGTSAAAGSGDAARNVVTSAESMRRGRSVAKAYEQEAVDRGLSADDLHGMYQEIRDHDMDSVKEYNAKLAEARDMLPNKGKGLGRGKQEDAASVKYFDEAVDYFRRKNDPFFGDSTKLFDAIKAGNREPMTSEEAYQQALDVLIDRKANQQESVGDLAVPDEIDPRHPDYKKGISFDPEEFGKPLSDEEYGKGAIGGGQEAAQSAGREKRLTALKNAVVDQERQKNGLPPLMQAARLANPEVWDRAMAQLDADQNAAGRLVEELAKKNRATTVAENALLLQRKIALANEHERALRDAVAAFKPKAADRDIVELDRLYKREEDIKAQISQLDKVTRDTGTEWGRAGQFRKQLAAEDFTLSNMQLQMEAALKRPLTMPEKEALLKQHERITETTKAADAAEGAAEAAPRPQSGTEALEAPTTKELFKAKGQNEDAKDQFRRDLAAAKKKGQGWSEHLQDLLVKLRVNMVISSPVTLAKIAAASLERVAIAPLESLVGAVWSRLPGISKIAAAAPREGRGLSAAVEKRSFAAAFTEGFKDAWRTITTGRSELDTAHGGKQDVPREWLDYQFSLHDAMKAPAVRGEFTRSFLNRIDAALEKGQDATSPAALLRTGAEAYQDALAAKFRQENWLVDAYNKAVGALRRPDASIASRATGFGLKMLTPVVRIPTNLAFEVATHVFGLGTGAAQATRSWMKGIENLKPDEADAIMRQFKKGSLGAGALLLGYFNPTIFGGYYSGKRDDDDVKAGAAKLGGVNVPSWLMHNPLLEVLQFGATVRRASDKLTHRQEGGIGAGSAEAVLGLSQEIPFVRETSEAAKGLSHNANERGAFFGNLAKSLAVPQLVQWLAGRIDSDSSGEPVKRVPEGAWQHIKEGVPGLRGSLPTKQEAAAGKKVEAQIDRLTSPKIGGRRR